MRPWGKKTTTLIFRYGLKNEEIASVKAHQSEVSEPKLSTNSRGMLTPQIKKNIKLRI